jgi:hypothetical protein
MIEKIEQVTVLANDFHVENSSTQASEVVIGTAITALHGRSFTGLMALEPGIVPMTIEQPESMGMARASVGAPSGILNPRNQSISGRREDAQDWSISGITRASTGFAATISSDGDNSLMRSVPNGVNNHLDLPGYAPGWLNLNSNPQKRKVVLQPVAVQCGRFGNARHSLAPLVPWTGHGEGCRSRGARVGSNPSTPSTTLSVLDR